MREFNEPPEPLPPACRPSADRLNAALDGVGSLHDLDADPHAIACSVCRGRVRAARMLLAALAEPPAPPTLPLFTGAIVAEMLADRRTRKRRRAFAIAGGFALAAAVLIAVWTRTSRPQPTPEAPGSRDLAVLPPAPTPAPDRVPEEKPLRIGDELAKAGLAFQNSSRPITEPAASAPKVFAALAESLTKPMAQPAETDLGPARASLAELPVAARTGLEPVTGSAQKALSRLLKDVGAIQLTSKSKS